MSKINIWDLNWRNDADSIKEAKELYSIESDLFKENKTIFYFGFFVGKYGKGIEIYFRPPNVSPDAILYDEETNSVLNVEFESISSNFKQHGHDPEKCDLIVCQIDDYERVWKEPCPLPVFELLGGKLKLPKK